MDLKNKGAIVTGASKGIGRSTAIALAEAGAHVALSARTPALLEETAKEVEKYGVRAMTFVGDMSDEAQIKAFVRQTVDNFGRLDILVNNAGIGHLRPIAELTTAEWDEMFNLNIRGMFIATREALPHLRKAGKSAVVNVASLAGKNRFVGGGGYAATKHAVLAFSHCLMLEERQNGLRVLAICPGSVDTSFDRGRRAADDPKRQRILQPADVAASIIHMLLLPQHAMVSEIDMRPSNP